jgi:hypothetical protein
MQTRLYNSFTPIFKISVMKKNLLFITLSIICLTASYAQTYTFTNCGATGAVGPSQAQVNATYTGVNTLAGKVTSSSGIQQWTVPVTCTYRITAEGATGGGQTGASNQRGGYGASIAGDFTLTAGEVLYILVGQQGTGVTITSNRWIGGGGGGSFVVKSPYNTNASILVAAGGGGGRGNSTSTAQKDANASSTSGKQGLPTTTGGGAGGTNGSGGGVPSSSTNVYAAGGGGFLSTGNGTNGTKPGGGKSFVNGGVGGLNLCTTGNNGAIVGTGGFGGGGGAEYRVCASGNATSAGGGGGGYSGGGGGNNTGGAGGSINNGANPSNTVLSSIAHGEVTIQLIGTAPTAASFSAGATTLCVGDSSTYTASATGGTSVKYSILTGGASIDSTTGKATSVVSDFTVRATISNCVGSITVDRAVTVQTQTAAPSITTPLCAGATSVSGTSTANASVIVTVNGVAQAAVSANGAGAWSRSVAALTSGHSVTATAQVSGQCVSASSTAVVVLSSCSPTWLGTTSADWGTPGNWSGGFVPNSCASNVTIPAGTPFAPSITTASYTVGNVDIASGVNLTLTGNNLNVCGNWVAGTGADAVTVGTGNVVFQGTGVQTISGNTNFESLTVNSAGSYTNSGTTTISRLYRPQSGTLNNTGSLSFLSTSPSDIATIDLTTGNTGSITGNIIAQRYVPVGGSNQHYVSSPVNNLPLSQLGASGTAGFVTPTGTCDETQLQTGSPYGSVFRYSEANGASCSLAGWEVVTSGNAENARGYSAYLTGAGAPLSVTGAANMSATYIKGGNTNSNWTNTTLQGRSQNSGWTLVGNPYLSTLNLGDKTGAGFDNQAQVWQTSGPYAGTYQAVMMGGGSAFVAPFQGFMVHNNTPSTTIDFTVGRAECVNSTSTFYKTGNSNGTLSIKVAGNNYNDITKVVFDDQATNSFDVAVDANKLPVRLVQPSIATKVSNTLYSINNLESISTNPIVPMDFMAGTNGTFTFTVDDIATFDPTVMIYLGRQKCNNWMARFASK